MNFLSICSGIEAASVAWTPLGWKAIAFAEIDRFPSAVLAHHWPEVPNLGNLEGFESWPEELLVEVDAVAGGTPCQGFSLAGLRGSLSDARGNLTLIYAKLIDHIDRIRARHGRPPVVCIWENVPGVLNTDDNAFGCFLAALAGEDDPLQPPGGRWTDAGYVRGPSRAIAWRSFDAQYFGVAQRRERVFALAGAGGFRPEEILFECEGVRRDSPPSRESGERPAPTLSARTQGGGGLGTDFELDGGLIPETVGALCSDSHPGCYSGQDAYTGRLIPAVTHALTGKGYGVDGYNGSLTGDVAATMGTRGSSETGSGPTAMVPAIAFERRMVRTTGGQPQTELAHCLRSDANSGDGAPCVATSYAVRRLVPEECEALQGFPRGHTRIPYRGKPPEECPDGPRYKACGNSWAVPVARWIGQRIQQHLATR